MTKKHLACVVDIERHEQFLHRKYYRIIFGFDSSNSLNSSENTYLLMQNSVHHKAHEKKAESLKD